MFHTRFEAYITTWISCFRLVALSLLLHTDRDSNGSVKYATTSLDTTANERERLNTVAYDDVRKLTKVNGKN